MLEAQLNIFDTVVLAIVGLSALMAFFRGFIKEVFSLGAWIGAGIITVYWFPEATKLVRPHVNSDVVATGIGTLGLYITSLLGLSIINSLLMKYVKSGSDVGVFDNVLGLGFGAARGVFIVALGFLLLMQVYSKEQYPAWVSQAQTLPYVEKAADKLSAIAPQYMQDMKDAAAKAQDTAKSTAQAVDDKTKNIKLPNPADATTPTGGYKVINRQDMDRLIDSVSSSTSGAAK